MKPAAILTLFLGLGVCACTVGPDFTRPDAPAPASFAAPGDAPAPADQPLAPSEPAARWWTAFGNAALDGVVDEALAGAPDLDIARARVAEAEESLKAAQAQRLPQASLGATAGRQKYGASLFGPLDFTIPPFTYYVVGPSVSFPLDLFGGQRRTIEQQAAVADYRRRQLDEARLTLEANVVSEALAIATARAGIAAAQQVLADDQRNIDLVRTSIDLGAGVRPQLVEAESQLAADETLLPPLREQESAARHALAILVGKPPADWAAPDFALADFTLPGEIGTGLPSTLARRRPDILAAEAQLHAASAAIGVATADLYPKINLTGTYTQQALTPGGLFDGSAGAWAIAAGLTQPLFNGGRLKAERRAAVDRYQAALAGYRKTVLAAFGEVADDLQAQADDADQLSHEAGAAATAASALDLARRSYAIGSTGVLDVLGAERRDAAAQIALSRATAQRLLDTVRLDAALGGGVEEAPQPTTRSAPK
jgi:NodT family efflux transporter outer membrane factor (OMF) lipoprotein